VTGLESDYYAFMAYDPEHTKAGLSHYLPLLAEGPVLELACGRGELLGLLRDAGVEARGVDADEGMVARARAAGLDVDLGDALDALRAQPDGSLRGVFSAHFVEHLPPAELMAVVTESARVLAPGGVFVAATPNAASLSVAGYDFWRDPTHVRFYDPQLLAFLCDRAGLEVVQTGENPRNAGGPPPGTSAPVAHVDPDLRSNIAAAVQRAGQADRRHETGWHELGHLVAVLEERLRDTQQQLRELSAAHEQLLQRLYPPNEVYVVARAR
jgi:SAM-dependent methyltransferase